MKRSSRVRLRCLISLAAVAVVGHLGFAAQAAEPPVEAVTGPVESKNILPSQDGTWSVLRQTHIELDFKRGTYVATYPPKVKALVGKTLVVEGFVTPVKAETEFRHFLLMPYAPGCPFCPPADFNEIIEVTVDRAIRAETRLFKVTGKFATQDNGKEGLFFRLDEATAQ